MRFTVLCLLAAMSLAAFSQAHDGSITAKVLDLNKEPVGGVKLVFTHEHHPDYKVEAETKTNGSVVLRKIKVGPIDVNASKEGYVTRDYEYMQEGGNVRITWIMAKESTTYESLGPQPKVFGTLESNAGPVADADIRISSEDLPAYEQITKTDANGYFEAPSLTWATVRIHAKKEGMRDQLYEFTQLKKDYKVKNYKMMTLEEYFDSIGQPIPGKKEKSPEEVAIEFYNKAVDPYKSKDYAQAEALLERALEKNPKMEQALKMMVYINHSQQKWDKSIEWSNKVLEVNPTDTKTMQFAEEAARMAGNKEVQEKFQAQLTAAGVIKEDTPDSLYNDAVDALNSDDDAKAKPILEKVLKMDDKHAEAHRQIAMVLLREYEMDDALNHLKLFLKYAPKSHQARKEVTELIVTLSE